jgi:shikimate dehydrogenase
MKQFAVIGSPIEHSLSPILHQEIYHQLNISASYDKKEVTKHQLNTFVNTNKLNGFNVTLPHKQTILPFLKSLDDSAKKIGAVNCVYKGKGYNTDWIGFLETIKNNDLSLDDKSCVIIGAGGAARAISYGLIKNGIKSISIKNRTMDAEQKLLEWINTLHPTNSLNDKPNIIINCAPLGMWPKINSMPDIEINNKSTLIETVYNPLETKWLRHGKNIGAKTISGLDMFIWQGIASTEIWMGEKISEKIELEKVKKVLKLELC